MKYDLSHKLKLQQFEQDCTDLKTKGAICELREIRQKRSIDQNSLYWVWLSALSFESGYLKDDLHRLFRAKFLSRQDYDIESIIRPELWLKMKKEIDGFHHFEGLNRIIDLISLSTTETDTQQYAEYLKNIQNYARENFGVILVNLDEANFKEFYREYGYI